MAGKDELADAVLGGASDYMSDIFAKIIQWYEAKDDQKVGTLFLEMCLLNFCSYLLLIQINIMYLYQVYYKK